MSSKKRKKSIYKKYILKRSIIYSLVVTVLVVGLIISMTTKKGIVYSGVRKVLDGLGIYTEELREATIESPNYSNPGSFKIDKSFEWIDYKKIKVKYDLTSKIKTGDKYKDVILVLDVSGSMGGDKLSKAKEDIADLINYLLEDSNNSIALITFETESTIRSGFSNDKEALLQTVDSIGVAGCTNYYAALSNVYDLMSSYTPSNDHDVVTVFMTDGYPNEDTPSEVTMYQAIKQKYPYMEINGIEFEMGNKTIPEVDAITDNIWISNIENLQNDLFQAAVSPDAYDNFIVDNYVSSYFTLQESDIKTDQGEVALSTENNKPKISWNLGENLRAGSKATMEVVLTIKDDYMVNQNYYPLSSKDEITYSLNSNSNTINNTNNLVTKNFYDVKYDTNTPEGCNLSNISKGESAAFTNVTKNQNKLSCGGYLFKGFEIRDLDDSDIQYMNDDVFVMPGHDVEIKGVWSKQSVYKTMDGTVKESATLYNALKEQEGTLTLKYTGGHHDSFDREPDHDVYHYYARSGDTTTANTILESNNVIFADYCWQMIRTTDTGGVKMIYNGPVVDGKCSTDRNKLGSVYEGFYSVNTAEYPVNSTTGYYYGKDYIYDTETKKFTLIDYRTDLNLASNKNEILSTYRYRCVQSNTNVCSSLKVILSAVSDNPNIVLAATLSNSSGYSNYGTTIFNSGNTLVDVSYMYNKKYDFQKSINLDNGILLSNYMGETYTYYYSSHVRYNNGQYELVNCTDDTMTSCTQPTEAKRWSLYKDDTQYNQEYRYTCLDTSKKCAEVYYVIDTTTVKNNVLVRLITEGDLPINPDGTISLSKEITDNEDGTYSIGDSQGENKLEITRIDWYNNYSTYFPSNYNSSNEKYYYCKDYSGRCNIGDLRYLLVPKKSISIKSDGIRYLPVQEIKFGSSFKYENNKYILDGTTYDIWNYDSSTEQSKIANAHYTCFNDTGECQDIAYVFYYAIDYGLYYVNLSGGVGINQAIDEMLYSDNVNTYDSVIKMEVDWWFERNIKRTNRDGKDYSVYLEETVFCNDRRISNLGGFNPNGGNIKNWLTFKNDYKSIECVNDTDKFSISNNKAKLKYSIGLFNTGELFRLNSSTIRKGVTGYYCSDAFSFYNSAYVSGIGNSGDLQGSSVTNVKGVRPAISLAPGTEYTEGDGSMDRPYVVDTGE